MQTYYLTDTGRVREHNEDNVIIEKNASGDIIMAVADGMGGHSAGEIASSIATTYLGENFLKNFNATNELEAANWLRQNIIDINDLIIKHVEKHPKSKGMGTTLVCALVTDDYVLMANVGDSRGYIMKNGELYRATYDHTLVNLLLKAGEISLEEAKNHPKKNILMRALGSTKEVEADIFECATDGDAILLASDGLTSMLEDDQIEEVLLNNEPIDSKVRRLIVKANNRGGLDNISIAYLQFKESGFKK